MEQYLPSQVEHWWIFMKNFVKNSALDRSKNLPKTVGALGSNCKSVDTSVGSSVLVRSILQLSTCQSLHVTQLSFEKLPSQS